MNKSSISPKIIVLMFSLAHMIVMIATYLMTLASAKPMEASRVMQAPLIMAGIGTFMVVGALLAMRGVGSTPEDAPATVSAFQTKIVIALAIIELPVLISNFLLSNGTLDSTARLMIVVAGLVMVGLFVIPRGLVTANYLESNNNS